jgi:ribonucleotide reductase alpha subunit
VTDTSASFDFDALISVVKLAVVNLNKIIDKNYYPTEKTRLSNMKTRPIGIGVQGLADVFCMMRMPFDSPAAADLNRRIFETMYYAALSQSTRICREEQTRTKKPAAYPSMTINGGAPIARGIFHWERYGLTADKLTSGYDWETLREHIKTFGVKNSLLIALMPTASTSQLLSNNECIEPYTSNVYKRKTLAGEFIIINKHLLKDLHELGLWSDQVRDVLIASDGSIQNIDGIPDELKRLYKTAWEIDPAVLIQLAIDRQPFIDQAQSLNWYIEDLKLDQFNKLAFQAWRGKLKTGKYYLHSRPAVGAQKFTIDPALQAQVKERKIQVTYERTEVCDLCSS